MSTLHFVTKLDRDGIEQDVRVTALIEDYSEARGVPAEYRSRFAGRQCVQITEIEFEGASLSDTELAKIMDCAQDRLCYQ